jgi:hypothetical protein
MNRRNIFKLIAGAACAAAMEINGVSQRFFPIPGDPLFSPPPHSTITKYFIKELIFENNTKGFRFADESGVFVGPSFDTFEEAGNAFMGYGARSVLGCIGAWHDTHLSKTRPPLPVPYIPSEWMVKALEIAKRP